MEEPHRGAIACLMDPRSVAVIGATERPDASSFFVMRNLLAKGFSGAIHPVNPRGGTVFGLPAVPSIASIEAVPDVVVIGIAADRVEAALGRVLADGAARGELASLEAAVTARMIRQATMCWTHPTLIAEALARDAIDEARMAGELESMLDVLIRGLTSDY